MRQATRLRLLLATATTMLLAACGSDTAPSQPAPEAESAAATDEPAAKTEVDVPDEGAASVALAKWTGDLDGMIERRIIRVLTVLLQDDILH